LFVGVNLSRSASWPCPYLRDWIRWDDCRLAAGTGAAQRRCAPSSRPTPSRPGWST